MSDMQTFFEIQSLIQDIFLDSELPVDSFNGLKTEAVIRRVNFLLRDVVSSNRSRACLTQRQNALRALDRINQRDEIDLMNEYEGSESDCESEYESEQECEQEEKQEQKIILSGPYTAPLRQARKDSDDSLFDELAPEF